MVKNTSYQREIIEHRFHSCQADLVTFLHNNQDTSNKHQKVNPEYKEKLKNIILEGGRAGFRFSTEWLPVSTLGKIGRVLRPD
jgi:hypothetical protein